MNLESAHSSPYSIRFSEDSVYSDWDNDVSDFARVHNTHLRTCMFPVRMTPQSLLLPFGQAISMFVCVGITGKSLLSIMCLAESSFALDRQTVNETTMISETSPKGALSFPAHIPMLISCIAAVALLSLVCHMFPAQGNALRTPPSWNPDQEYQYPFRQWARNIMLWSIATDLEPARKAASVLLVLKGAAKELARQIPPQAIVEGGLVNNVFVDPLTYLMHALQERFGNLGEEVRVQAVTDLMGFSRRNHETIDSLLVRFGSIRGRAADQGGAILSVQGITWILLRAIGISDQQLIQLLAPFNGLFPSTEAEYTQLKTNRRRMGHILERTPGNLRDGLRSSQIASSAFLTHDEPWNPEPTQWGARASETHGWSGESAFAASASCSSVDAFATFQDDDIDTDSNTSSGECSSIPDDGQDPNAVAQRLFWAYKQAKHKWRKYMGKSTRAVRRYAKHFDRNKGKGKGKSGKFAFPVGKGKGKKGKHLMTAMLAEMTDDEVQQALPAFRGNRSPGKGKTDASLRSVQACHA